MSPIRYLGRFLDKTDATASLKHLAYAVVVGFGCFWLTWDMLRGPITSEWNMAFLALLAAVTTGKVVGSGPAPAPTVGAAAPPAPAGVVLPSEIDSGGAK